MLQHDMHDQANVAQIAEEAQVALMNAKEMEDEMVDEKRVMLHVIPELEDETHQVIFELLDAEKPHPQTILVSAKIMPFVEYEGHKIYKSTLVVQLNSISFLFKGCLTQIRNVVHFSNIDAYFDASLCSSRIMRLGLDVGGLFCTPSIPK